MVPDPVEDIWDHCREHLTCADPAEHAHVNSHEPLSHHLEDWQMVCSFCLYFFERDPNIDGLNKKLPVGWRACGRIEVDPLGAPEGVCYSIYPTKGCDEISKLINWTREYKRDVLSTNSEEIDIEEQANKFDFKL